MHVYIVNTSYPIECIYLDIVNTLFTIAQMHVYIVNTPNEWKHVYIVKISYPTDLLYTCTLLTHIALCG